MTQAPLALAYRVPFLLMTVAALLYSGLLAKATYLAKLGSPADLAKAIEFVSYNANYLTALDATRPEPDPNLLSQSLALNPFQSGVWIRLGLFAEMHGKDVAKAERYYEKAASVDHMAAATVTLANFYARRQDAARFFPAAKIALKLMPSDSRPILFQARMLASSPEQVISILPDRQRVLFEYLSFLLSTEDPTLLKSAAIRATDKPIETANLSGGLQDFWSTVIGTAEDRLLQAGMQTDAIDVWNNMKRHRWVQSTTPSTGVPITNGSFEQVALEHGFDWSIPSVTGVVHDQYPSLGKLTFNLDGTQPEECRLMGQFIPVTGGASYRMTWDIESTDLRGETGLKWRIYATAPKTDADRLVLTSPMVDLKGSGNWEFVTPAGWKTALVTLEYERPLGQVRAEGSVNLRKVSMISVPNTSHSSGGSL